jgi:hypothetical protein
MPGSRQFFRENHLGDDAMNTAPMKTQHFRYGHTKRNAIKDEPLFRQFKHLSQTCGRQRAKRLHASGSSRGERQQERVQRFVLDQLGDAGAAKKKYTSNQK